MNIIICQRESVTALQMFRTVGFLQKLSTIDDVTKYRGIPVSRYFLRRYITVGHFLIQCIPNMRRNTEPTYLLGDRLYHRYTYGEVMSHICGRNAMAIL